MTLFSTLRLLAFARRMARALERTAAAAEEQARISTADWERRTVRRKPTPIQIDSLDLAESNKLWREQRRAALAESEEEAEEHR